MSGGELLTKVTIWVSLTAYALGALAFGFSRNRYKWDSIARLALTAGCVALLAHVACAFHFYHGWSHESAYRETARQTAEVFGVDWGGGLYINYAFIIGWILNVVSWWRGLDLYRSLPVSLLIGWQVFMLFIFFNATVIFGKGALRWIGLGVCLAVCFVWRLNAEVTSQGRR
jgi:hypothetical protein